MATLVRRLAARTDARRRRGRPLCSGWSRNGSCCPTCRSPTCCCGCRRSADEEAGGAPAFLCVAQCRPTTGADRLPGRPGRGGLGARGRPAARPPSPRAGSSARETRTGTATSDPPGGGPGPGRRRRVVAVLGRDGNLASVRTPSQLELVYLQSAADLAAMVADGTFPAADSPAGGGGPGPRVGRRPAAPRPRRHDHLRQPQRAVGASTGSGVTGNVVSEPIDALTSTVGRRPVRRRRPRRARSPTPSTAATRPASRSTAAARPCCSARCRCARAARRSARCCSCRTSPSCAAGTGRS